MISFVDITNNYNYNWYLLPPLHPDAQTLIGLYEEILPSAPQSAILTYIGNGIPIAPTLTLPDDSLKPSRTSSNNKHNEHYRHKSKGHSRHSPQSSGRDLSIDDKHADSEDWRRTFNQSIRERLLPFTLIDNKLKPIDVLEFEPMTKTERATV